MNLELKRRIEQIGQRWWVVLVVTAVAVLMAALPLLHAHPTYVGRSALQLSSPSRIPEQDAMIAVGYATFFNEPATIGRLRERTPIRADATFEARTVAASPILIIEATADDPKIAQDAAESMGVAFRDEINAAQRTATEALIANLQRQRDSLSLQPAPDGSMNPLLPDVQQRIDEIQSDSTNQLKDLLLRAGVTKVASSPMFNLALGAAGGLLLGILAALGLAKFSTRLTSSADLLDKTGIEPLVEMPGAGSKQANKREDRLRRLANVVSLQDLPKSRVVALTDSGGAEGARALSEVLASLSARQGYRTVLVYADGDASQPTMEAGFNDALAYSSLAGGMLKDGPVDSLKILHTGSVVADCYSLMSRERIVAVLDELHADADTIVVAAPSIADSTDSLLICAAADLTLLVVAKGSSRAGDVTAAVEALANAHAVLLGAVLIDGREGS